MASAIHAELIPWDGLTMDLWIFGINATAAAALVAIGSHALLRSVERAYAKQWSLRRELRHRNARLADANAALELEAWHKELLMREIHHRVKNNLQVLTSLTRIKYGGTDASTAGNEIQHRAECLARIQDLHYGNDLVEKLAFHDVLMAAVASLTSGDTGVEVTFDTGDGAREYGADQSTALGLLLCEVLEPWTRVESKGRRRIHLSTDATDAIRLTITPPPPQSFGEPADMTRAPAAQVGVSVQTGPHQGKLTLVPLNGAADIRYSE